jgi:PAS domain S-box-containing protein
MFDTLIDAFPDFAMVVDREGRLLSGNKNAMQKLAPKTGARRQLLFDIFPHINPENWRKMFFRFLDEKKVSRFEKTVDGQYYFHHFYPVIDKDGVIDFVVVFIQDITEFRHAENALQESEKKYRELVENISDAIYALNEEGAVIYINPAVENFLGFSQDEVKGRTFQEFLHPAEVALVMSDLEGFLAGRSPQREYRFLHKDGSVRWGRVSSQPVIFKDEVIGYQGVIADITQVKTFSINLLKTVQENILASLASAFTAEIGIPLKRARERLLSHTAPDGNDREIDGSLRDLMHDLEGISLSLKHISAFAGRDASLSQELDVNTAAESALVLLKQQFDDAGATVRWALARDLQPVAADSFSLVQAFMNIFNYVLHSWSAQRGDRVRKEIGISTSMEQDKVIIAVHDPEGGISKELLAHLADPYYTHRQKRGAGIDLAIARQLIESQGGFFAIGSGNKEQGLAIRISFSSVIPTI